MSLYNNIFGFDPACTLILPMLGRKMDEYPRFRDCFIEGDSIVVFTRVGGGNRNCGFEEEKLYEDENFIETWDDNFDNTYGYYRFSVPEKWKNDFSLISQNRYKEISQEYQDYLKSFYS